MELETEFLKRSEISNVSSLTRTSRKEGIGNTTSPERPEGQAPPSSDLRHPARVTRDTSLPWLARISRQSPSLALTRLAWGCTGATGKGDTEGERRGMLPSFDYLPFACNIYACARSRAHERARTSAYTYTILRP